MKKKNVIYTLFMLTQALWGLPQTLLGFVVFLIHINRKHYFYHGTIVTEIGGTASVSLGLFLFIAYPIDTYTGRKLLQHEYGHSVQSLILGPLYLFFIGIPSVLWAYLPFCRKLRKNGMAYSAFITEANADWFGNKVCSIFERNMI